MSSGWWIALASSCCLIVGCSAATDGSSPIPEPVESSEQAAKPVPPSCAAILCAPGYVCEDKGGHGHCFRIKDPCATLRCRDGYACVASGGLAACEPVLCADGACGPALGMPNALCPDGVTVSGPTGNCLEYSTGCGWEVVSCP